MARLGDPQVGPPTTGPTYQVGKTADLVVHVRDEATAMTDDRITVAGHVQPRRLDDNVVTLSTHWPRPQDRPGRLGGLRG